MLNHGSGSRPVTQPVKMKLLSKMPIRERHCWDGVLQEAIDEAVRRGDLEPVGLNADGQMVYRGTTKLK